MTQPQPTPLSDERIMSNDTQHEEPHIDNDSSIEESTTFRQRVRSTMSQGFQKAVHATILNTHPSCAPIDGMVQMDGEFVKDTFDATILNKHPSGANVDHAVNLFWLLNASTVSHIVLNMKKKVRIR